jgi:lipase ATG15
VFLVNGLQSRSVQDVSFYRVTTPFVESLKEDFEHVQVTGHSLGGGLSIITGAQAQVPAVALSGPNALISGGSFYPPVTPEMLNRYTFNIIPNRDIVPMFDDAADQFQNIRCNAPFNNFIECHDSTRSLCEIMYTCGTGSRPALCECVDFGFPKPLTLGDRDFDEVCKKKRNEATEKKTETAMCTVSRG